VIIATLVPLVLALLADGNLQDDDPGLALILRPKSRCPTTGHEIGRAVRHGVSRYSNAHGSVRYVLTIQGTPVGGLQVVTKDGKSALVANLYVVPGMRRQGIASHLLAKARRDFATVTYPGDESLSADGKAFRDADTHLLPTTNLGDAIREVAAEVSTGPDADPEIARFCEQEPWDSTQPWQCGGCGILARALVVWSDGTFELWGIGSELDTGKLEKDPPDPSTETDFDLSSYDHLVVTRDGATFYDSEGKKDLDTLEEQWKYKEDWGGTVIEPLPDHVAEAIAEDRYTIRTDKALVSRMATLLETRLGPRKRWGLLTPEEIRALPDAERFRHMYEAWIGFLDAHQFDMNDRTLSRTGRRLVENLVGARILGNGATRIAFDLEDGRILKMSHGLAVNDYGEAANEHEVEIWLAVSRPEDGRAKDRALLERARGIFLPILDWDQGTGGGAWIVMPKVTSLADELGSRDTSRMPGDVQDQLERMDTLVEELRDATNLQLAWGDVVPRNVARYEGRLVLLDYGA
jgi:GNAT superfamily N-acetyltransferase